MNAELSAAEQLNKLNRAFIGVISTILCLLVLLDGVLNEWRTQRITNRLATTPGDVRQIVEDLVDKEQKSINALTEVLYFVDLLEASSDAFVQIDTGGYISRWSRGAELLFGYDRTEVLGLHVGILMPPGDAEKHRDKYSGAMLTDATVSRRRLFEVPAITSNGTEIFVRLQLWIAPRVGAVARVTKIEKPTEMLIQ